LYHPQYHPIQLGIFLISLATLVEAVLTVLKILHHWIIVAPLLRDLSKAFGDGVPDSGPHPLDLYAHGLVCYLLVTFLLAALCTSRGFFYLPALVANVRRVGDWDWES